MAKEKFDDSKVDRRSERADKEQRPKRKKGKKGDLPQRPAGFKPNYKSILGSKFLTENFGEKVRYKKDFHIACMTTEAIVFRAKQLARWCKKNENIVGVTDEDLIMKQKRQNALRLQICMNELEYREVPMQIIRGLNSYIADPAEQEKFFDKKKIDWIFMKHIEEVRYYAA